MSKPPTSAAAPRPGGAPAAKSAALFATLAKRKEFLEKHLAPRGGWAPPSTSRASTALPPAASQVRPLPLPAPDTAAPPPPPAAADLGLGLDADVEVEVRALREDLRELELEEVAVDPRAGAKSEGVERSSVALNKEKDDSLLYKLD